MSPERHYEASSEARNAERLRNAFRDIAEKNGSLVLCNLHFTAANITSLFTVFPLTSELRVLDLTGTRIDDEVFETLIRAANVLPKLEVLLLCHTQIRDAGMQILANAAENHGLPQLRHLELTGTSIGDDGLKALASIVGTHGLPSLEVLNLNDTLIGDSGMATFVVKARKMGLPKLQALYLSRTRIGDNGVRSLDLANNHTFPRLESLWLDNTTVGNIGVKAIAGLAKRKGLANLQILLLSQTQLSDGGVEEIAEAAEAKGLLRLAKLDLDGTQVSDDGIEALDRAAKAGGFPQLRWFGASDTQVTIAMEELATHDPKRIFAATKEAYIAEAKLVVIGAPGAGKSSFCNRFFLNEVPSERKETHDIELIIPRWKPRVGDLDIKLKVWDFGGQHVLHGTHEMFLTHCSVAILVLDVTNSLDDNLAEYWIKLLCYCAGRTTPTIVVVTKCDKPETSHIIGQFEPQQLQFDLTQPPQLISGFSSAPTPLPKRGQPESMVVENLRSALANAIQGITGIHEKVPRELARMRRRVEREMKNRSLVSLQEYHDWCSQEFVDDSGLSILRTLHHFGSALFFGRTDEEQMSIQDEAWLAKRPPGEQRFLKAYRDSILCHWIVNPHWVKWPIGEITQQFDNVERAQSGRMTYAEIVDFATQSASAKGLKMLPEEPEFIAKLLEFTGICCELEKGEYLFAQGLPSGRPYNCDLWKIFGWWEWGFLPEYIFHRFVVSMHQRKKVVRSEGKWQHWPEAVVIEYPAGCRGVVLADPARGRLEARLDPISQAPQHYAKLGEYLNDLFETEFVKQQADRKDFPSIDIVRQLPDLEFVAPIVIYKAIKHVFGEDAECLPYRTAVPGWKVQDNGKEGHGKKFHIEAALKHFAKHYRKKMGKGLSRNDRRKIRSFIDDHLNDTDEE